MGDDITVLFFIFFLLSLLSWLAEVLSGKSFLLPIRGGLEVQLQVTYQKLSQSEDERKIY